MREQQNIVFMIDHSLYGMEQTTVCPDGYMIQTKIIKPD